MIQRACSRVAATLFAAAAFAAPASAGFVTGLGEASGAAVHGLSAEQAEALGAPGADRIGFVDLSGGPSGEVAFGPFSAATLFSAAADPSKILGIVNGDATAGINYMGDAYEPFQAAFVEAGLSSIERAFAILFDGSEAPISYGVGGSPLFAGPPSGPFAPTGGGLGEGRDDGLNLDAAPRNAGGRVAVPLPAGGALMIAALIGLGWTSRRRRA